MQSMIKSPEILEYLVKNVSGISRYNLKKRLYDILNTFESLGMIEKVLSKKNNRTYQLMKNNEFITEDVINCDNVQGKIETKIRNKYLKLDNQVKLLKTRIQLKMNIKKNIMQKTKFYNFQINKNKNLSKFCLKPLQNEDQKMTEAKSIKEDKRGRIKLPFVALELIDGQPVVVHRHEING